MRLELVAPRPTLPLTALVYNHKPEKFAPQMQAIVAGRGRAGRSTTLLEEDLAVEVSYTR